MRFLALQTSVHPLLGYVAGRCTGMSWAPRSPGVGINA